MSERASAMLKLYLCPRARPVWITSGAFPTQISNRILFLREDEPAEGPPANDGPELQSPVHTVKPIAFSFANNAYPKMKHLAAFLLLGLAGNTAPSAEQIKQVLASVGIDADEARLSQVLAGLKEQNIDELIAQGSEKLASVSSGAVAAAAPAAGGAAAAAEGEKQEEKKEEVEESDEDMGLDLFG